MNEGNAIYAASIPLLLRTILKNTIKYFTTSATEILKEQKTPILAKYQR